MSVSHRVLVNPALFLMTAVIMQCVNESQGPSKPCTVFLVFHLCVVWVALLWTVHLLCLWSLIHPSHYGAMAVIAETAPAVLIG